MIAGIVWWARNKTNGIHRRESVALCKALCWSHEVTDVQYLISKKYGAHYTVFGLPYCSLCHVQLKHVTKIVEILFVCVCVLLVPRGGKTILCVVYKRPMML